MADFLQHMIDRNLATSTEARPRTPALYESPLGARMAPLPMIAAEHFDERPAMEPAGPAPSGQFARTSVASRTEQPPAAITETRLQSPLDDPADTPVGAPLANGHVEALEERLRQLDATVRRTSLTPKVPHDSIVTVHDAEPSHERVDALEDHLRELAAATRRPPLAFPVLELSGLATSDQGDRPQPVAEPSAHGTPDHSNRSQFSETRARGPIPGPLSPTDHPGRALAVDAPPRPVASTPPHERLRSSPPAPPVARRRAASPTITVSIGRIELQGGQSAPPPAAPPGRRKAPESRVMSLDRYLELRSRGALS